MVESAFKFEIVGLKETMDALSKLPTMSMQKNVVRSALKKASIPVLEDSKSNVQRIPIHGDKILKSMKVSSNLKRSQRKALDRSRVYMYIGASSPLSHLFEFGTAARFTKNRAYRGFISPMPFLRPAWDSKRDVSLRVLKEELWKSIQKSARLLAKKAVKGTLTRQQIMGLRK